MHICTYARKYIRTYDIKNQCSAQDNYYNKNARQLHATLNLEIFDLFLPNKKDRKHGKRKELEKVVLISHPRRRSRLKYLFHKEILPYIKY